MNQKLPLLFVCCLIASDAFAAGSHCVINIKQSDWPLHRYGSASAYIEAVQNFCSAGDHVLTQRLYVDEAGYFVATMCDPAFSINVIPIDEGHSSIACVFAGDKVDSLD